MSPPSDVEHRLTTLEVKLFYMEQKNELNCKKIASLQRTLSNYNRAAMKYALISMGLIALGGIAVNVSDKAREAMSKIAKIIIGMIPW